ncbi:hypothetical protein V6N13_090413 [Hibiscus sabdariffa]
MVDEWGSIITRSRWLDDATRNALAGRHSLSQSSLDASVPAPCWATPPSQWVKLNCNGAHGVGDSSTSWGVRDFAGEWLYGFFKFIGCCSIVEAELWGIWVGLDLAWNKGFRSIMAETDCVDAIRLLQYPSLKGSPIT